MTKYRISNYVCIAQLQPDSFEDVPKRLLADQYFLADKKREREFVINSTIKYFIDKFKIPKTKLDVFNEIKNELVNPDSKLKQTCYSFFDFLREQQVLVREDKREDWTELPPLFTKGAFVDKYKIVDMISDRGITELYKVETIKTRELLVLKCVNQKKATSKRNYDEERRDLKAEYRLLKKSDGIKAVPKVFEYKESDKSFVYFIQELIEGKSLMRYIDYNPSLLLQDCFEIISQFLEGFSGLHENKLIHGDIHSSNILVSANGQVRIIDLGMARNVVLEKNEVVKYGGVDFYMPPESINLSSFSKVSHPADLSSDVYQIGILMYIVLYNKLPFDGFTWEELAKHIKEEEPDYLSTSFQNFSIPKPVSNIIKKCLQKKPAKRYKNAIEITSDFNRYYKRRMGRQESA